MKKRMMILPALLVACVVEEERGVEWERQATAAAMPAPAIELSIPNGLTTTSTSEVLVTGALADETVHVLGGTRMGEGRCPVELGGACLDVLGASHVAQQDTEGDGTASVQIQAPVAMTGLQGCLQAVIPRGVDGADSVVSDVECVLVDDAACGYEMDADGTGYRVCAQHKTYADALADCESWGGTLAVVDDVDENDWLVSTAEQYGFVDPWIGFDDRVSEGIFVWADGSDTAYLNWHAGNPDDWGGGEDCAMILMDHGTWNDASCDASAPYFCERPS